MEMEYEKKQKNNTGIPDKIKSRFEAFSNMSFDDVKVHYNSPRPEGMKAYAYTKGSNVYIAPGQEKYLVHELGHVVQQKRGIVPATAKVNGQAVNDSPYMEHNADEIGSSAMGGSEVMQLCSGIWFS